MRASGILFKSVRSSWSNGTMRTPSRRTMLRAVPRLRRLMNEAPTWPLLTCALLAAVAPGRAVSVVGQDEIRLRQNNTAAETLTGADETRFGLRISVPVM